MNFFFILQKSFTRDFFLINTVTIISIHKKIHGLLVVFIDRLESICIEVLLLFQAGSFFKMIPFPNNNLLFSHVFVKKNSNTPMKFFYYFMSLPHVNNHWSPPDFPDLSSYWYVLIFQASLPKLAPLSIRYPFALDRQEGCALSSISLPYIHSLPDVKKTCPFYCHCL